MQDRIHREIPIQASREQVYDAIADPKKVIQWFPDAIEGDYVQGGQPVLDFGRFGKDRICIVEAIPHEYFAFRWVPGSSNFTGDLRTVATTLVEFHIREHGDGACLLTLTESGFSSLPIAIRTTGYEENAEGWPPMLARLADILQRD